ncbi:MAG: carbamate kinase, partial [Desulfobacterales bacterium]|nr:carbamate kinase [Desulfobacterales bacterium]
KKDHPDWEMVSDAGRGYRRVVASPEPVEIVEMDMIQHLVENNFCVIAAGGGGIPVVQTSDGNLEGVGAVIDKDYASALLAINLKADLLVISTGVDRVCINFGKENEKALSNTTIAEIKKYLKEGHFEQGSMLPKIQAILWFLENGGQKAIITRPDHLKKAIVGQCGTHII